MVLTPVGHLAADPLSSYTGLHGGVLLLAAVAVPAVRRPQLAPVAA